MEPAKKIKTSAVVGYEIRGVKSFKSIVYEIEYWALCLQGMQKTKEWEQVRDLVWNNRTDGGRIVGLTFNFSDDE